jgi:hypothetical protein
MLNRNIFIILVILVNGFSIYSQQINKKENLIPLSLSSLTKKNNSVNFKNPSLSVLSTKPEFILGAIAGGSAPLNELKGDLSSVSLTNPATSSPAYFESWGYNIGIYGKLPIGKKGNFRVSISLIYNRFFNSGDDSASSVTIEPNLNIFQAGLGLEYAFDRIGNVTPFIGAEFNANIFGGSIDFLKEGTSISYSYNRNIRYGFCAGAGAEYFINKTFGLIGGVKYNMANLIGKEYNSTGAHELDDESFTVNGVNINRKNINFLNFYAGIALYISDQ